MNLTTYKLIMGTIIILSLVILAGAIALGKVEEKTSFGLTGIIAILGKVALDFSQWAFSGDNNGSNRSTTTTEEKK